MESCIVLHNCLYPSSEILMQNLKTLLDKLNISVASTQKIALENKFLPCVNPIAYYQSLIKILKTAQRDEQRLLVCDSQSWKLHGFLRHSMRMRNLGKRCRKLVEKALICWN